jgi:hypothetical protein
VSTAPKAGRRQADRAARRAERARRAAEPLPAPLPPETRTVGQLVAESIRFYRHRFFQSLPLGLSAAVITQLAITFGDRHHPRAVGATVFGSGDQADVVFRPFNNADELAHANRALVGGGSEAILSTAVLGGLLLTVSYIGATLLVTGTPYDARRALRAWTVGILAFVPTPFLATLFYLPAIAWLAFVGLSVPAAVVEGTGVWSSFRRGIALAKADYVHALGGLATLVVTYVLTRFALFFTLQSAGESTQRVASFLADLVLSPMLFIGAVLLYGDQVARLGLRRPRRRKAAG